MKEHKKKLKELAKKCKMFSPEYHLRMMFLLLYGIFLLEKEKGGEDD